TKRYRSNCINWGILPFTLDGSAEFPYEDGDYVFVPDVRSKIAAGIEEFPAKVIRANGEVADIMLYVRGLTENEREIILEGCLMNYKKAHLK
ncbi:MAG: hydratase, partial [Clostridia bacterium]|nr:hydratase [Clostridia bacterium]